MTDALQPGDRIGHYIIESELGRGPLGISYRARDAVGEVVALKVLLAETPLTDSEKAAIAHDFHALEDLQSPQVPVLLEFVRYEDVYVIATDYLPQGDFSRRLAQGPLPLPAALTLIRHLTYAVGRAHEVGVVHGGIKPTNVLRGEANGRQVPVLSDFGGALRHHAWVRPEGVNEGDAYRAPELSDHGPATPASDVFSLGTLLAVMTGGLANAGVAGVIARATMGAPAQRYANATEMYEALSAVGSSPDPVAPVELEPVVLASAPISTEVSSVKAEASPQTPSEASVPTGAPAAEVAPQIPSETSTPVVTASTAPSDHRAAERARILKSGDIAASGRGYRSKGPLIAGVIAAALLVLALSLLLTKNNVFNQPASVPKASVLNVAKVAFGSAGAPNGGVRFTLAQPGVPSDDTIVRTLQVLVAGTWQPVTGTSYTYQTQPPAVGGKKICPSFRVADTNAGNGSAAYGAVVSACGTTAPTLSVTVDHNPCNIQGVRQVCYTFAADGLTPGITSELVLILDGQKLGGLTLTVDGAGHAGLPPGKHIYFAATSSGKYAVVKFAGMTKRFLVVQ